MIANNKMKSSCENQNNSHHALVILTVDSLTIASLMHVMKGCACCESTVVVREELLIQNPGSDLSAVGITSCYN